MTRVLFGSLVVLLLFITGCCSEETTPKCAHDYGPWVQDSEYSNKYEYVKTQKCVCRNCGFTVYHTTRFR